MKRDCRAEKKRRAAVVVALLLAVAATVISVFACVDGVAFAGNSAQEDVEKELSDNVDGTIERIDVDLFREFLDSLSDEQLAAVGIGDLKEALRTMTQSGAADFFQNFLSAFASVVGKYFLGFLPGFVTIVVICLLKNMLSGMTSGFNGTSTTQVVHVVCYSAVIVILMTGAVKVIVTVTETVNTLAAFSEAVFPVLLTLLAAVGGASGAAVYQPFMAVLSGFVIKLIQVVIIPAFIATIVFSVVGNISKNVKLDKLTKLFKSGAVWLIGIVFGLFATFLTAQGITGGVIDRLGFNAAKFAVSSYVPVLGGYLSDGFDLLSASVVLVKNAVGLTGVIVLMAIILFPLLQLVIFMLGLRLTAAVVEPVGDTGTSSVLGALADNMSLLITALTGVGFMFFLLLMLIIGSCNLGV